MILIFSDTLAFSDDFSTYCIAFDWVIFSQVWNPQHVPRVQGPDRELSHHPVLQGHGSQAQGQGSCYPGDPVLDQQFCLSYS